MIHVEINRPLPPWRNMWWGTVIDPGVGRISMPFRTNFEACRWALEYADRVIKAREKTDGTEDGRGGPE